MTRISPATTILLFGVLAIIAVILGSCHGGSDGPDVSPAAVGLRGDLDGDGSPSVGDAIAILRIVVGFDAANPAADADGDGSTSVNDAIAVLRCVVGLAEWPLGEYTLPPTRTIGPGAVTETDFAIGADERVECLGDTIIECSTATIAGELYSSSPTAAGTNAGSITIEAQGDVILTGAMQAGNGSDGDLTVNSAQGGNGGSVTINSADGDITIGVEVQTSADAPNPYLGAGDAGVGADDLTTAVPGAGGQGGSVSVSCPNGLLTLHPRSGLIHLGNGGDGGTGHVPVDSEADLSQPPDHSPDGGDSGLLTMLSETFAGLEEQDGALVVEPSDMLTGGNGGDGGALWIRVEVGTDPDEIDGAATGPARIGAVGTAWRAQSAPNTVEVGDDIGWADGGDGGNAVCPGAAGYGGICGGRTYATGDYGRSGGNGGNLSFSFLETASGGQVPVVVPNSVYRGGGGGGGWTWGDPGKNATECQHGAHGHSGYGRGGNGGRVIEDGLPAVWLANMDIVGGNGGWAQARAGGGGSGGDCCGSTPGIGGRGGDAGPNAFARGGNGGDQVAGTGGDAGPAEAEGQDGGNGGDGISPGAGGRATTSVIAIAGQPGEGSPPGAEGTITTSGGSQGTRGERCPGAGATYTVLTGASSTERILGHLGWFAAAVGGSQAEPDFTLGGDGFPIVAATGNTMHCNADGSRLWVADELRGVSMFSDPLTGGDRAPDLVLSPGADKLQSIWYDEPRDTIYATSPTTSFIYAWDGASAGGSRPPDRSIEIAGYLGGASLTGATGSDRLFVAATVNTVRKMLVYDQAHLADGTQPPSRVFEPQEFSLLSPALDAQRDILYLRARAAAAVQVYTSASTREGVVTPDRTITVSFPGMAAGDWVTSLAVAPENDLLFVGMVLGQLLVYTDASTLQGTPLPAQRELLDDNLFALGVFGQ